MKKTLAVILAFLTLVGVLSLCACDEEVTVGEGPFGKYSPSITVTYGKPVTAISDVLNALGETAEDNVWNTYIRKELGVKLNLTLGMATDVDYYTKLTTAVSAGMVPDFLEVGYFEAGFSNLKMMNENDALYALDEVIEQYASDDLKEVIDSYDPIIFRPCTFDGKIKGFPQFYNVGGASAGFYWIRTDWLENLNLKMPETYDELINVMKAFTYQDPDGNNVKDTYGLAADSSVYGSFAGLFSAYGCMPQAWVDDGSGHLVYGGIQPEIKEVLRDIKELYASGVIKDDFSYLTPGVDAGNQMNSGTAGIVVGAATSGLNYAQTIVRNHSANIECVPFIAADGHEVRVLSSIPAYTFYAVSKDTKYPEVLIKILNLYLDVSEGERGSDLLATMIQDEAGNEIWKLSPANTMGAIAPSKADELKYDQLKELAEAIEKRDDSRLRQVDKSVYASVSDYLDNGIYKNWGWYALFKENGSLQKLVDAREVEGYFAFSMYSAAPSENMNKYLEALDVMQWTAYVNIIVGEAELDSFDTFVTEWLATGGEEITAEVNEWYSQFKD